MRNDLVIDQRYIWQGHANGVGTWESSCRLRIFKPHPEQVFVVLTNSIMNDEGTTVCNCAENLLPKIAVEFALEPLITIWLYHCIYADEPSSVSLITLTLGQDGRRQVNWSHVPQEQAESWIGIAL